MSKSLRIGYITDRAPALTGNGLMIRPKRNSNGITKADRAAQKSGNLIQQDFSANAPNEKWLTDITEIPCKDANL